MFTKPSVTNLTFLGTEIKENWGVYLQKSLNSANCKLVNFRVVQNPGQGHNHHTKSSKWELKPYRDIWIGQIV